MNAAQIVMRDIQRHGAMLLQLLAKAVAQTREARLKRSQRSGGLVPEVTRNANTSNRFQASEREVAPRVQTNVSKSTQALGRLTGIGRTGLGTLFKVMAFTHRDLMVPPGFEH